MGHSARPGEERGESGCVGTARRSDSRSYTQGFGKAFPDISIEVSGARGGELATRIKAERDAGIYMLMFLINGTSTANSYFELMKALDPIEPALILPEVIRLKNWRDNRLEFSDRSTHLDLVFCTQNNVPVIWNPAQVKPRRSMSYTNSLTQNGRGRLPFRIRFLQEPATAFFAGYGMCSVQRRPKIFIERSAPRRPSWTETSAGRSSGSPRGSTFLTLARAPSCISSRNEDSSLA